MTTSHTPRFSLPIPTWNADWQKWQQVFETFANGVDSTLFSLLEHITLIPRVLPTVSIAGGVFSQSGPAQFISRTLQVEVGVGPNALTLVPRALVCAHLQSGAVGPQAIEWELRITSAEVDADLVVFGVVGDDYAITWYNGARLEPGTPMALFAFPGTGGGGGLDPAPFDWVFAPTVLSAAQNGQYFFCLGSPLANGDLTLPLAPTAGMQFTAVVVGNGITVNGNGAPILGPGGLSSGVAILGNLFNFNLPTSFPLDPSGELLGYGGAGIVRLGTDLYGTKRAGSQQHGGGTPVAIGPGQIWKLIESGRSDLTGTSPVVCTLDGFAWLNDDGWECEFIVGVDAAQDTVPMTVKTPPFTTDICIEGARYANSITCADVGGYVRLRWAPWGIGRGHFIVTGGRGTWTDNDGGIHHLGGEHVFLETWDQAVAAGTTEVGVVDVGVAHGLLYSLKIEIVGGTAPTGADIELADAVLSGSHELLYQIGMAGVDPRWQPSVNPTWKDRTPFGIEGLSAGQLHWRLNNMGSAAATFRVTLRGMGWS